jgi:hypothetical protein
MTKMNLTSISDDVSMTINGSKIDLKIALYYSQNSIIMTCILAFKD